jgi:hypothetical protein
MGPTPHHNATGNQCETHSKRVGLHHQFFVLCGLRMATSVLTILVGV